jgi:hypothetical protein
VVIDRKQFESLVLERVQPEECLRHLGALVSPHPFELQEQWLLDRCVAGQVGSIVEFSLTGQAHGDSIADVLLGHVNGELNLVLLQEALYLQKRIRRISRRVGRLCIRGGVGVPPEGIGGSLL